MRPPPLKVLVAACHHIPEARSYVEQIQDAISGLAIPGGVDLTTLDDPTFDELCDAVKDNRPHVFHLIAHGKPAGLFMKRDVSPDQARANAILREAGERVPADGVLVRAQAVRSMFGYHRPHLVVLHACDGDAPGPISADDAPALTQLFSTAREIAYAGVPAVVAMQYQISVDQALMFVTDFYGALAGGATVSDATKQGRTKLARKPPPEGQDEFQVWATRLFGAPVVYVGDDVPLIAGQEAGRAPGRQTSLGAPRPGASGGQGTPRLRRCSSCGTGNNPARGHCRQCGASLRVCAICGYEYDDPQKDEYCACGVSLWLDSGGGRDRLAVGPQDPGLMADGLRRPASV